MIETHAGVDRLLEKAIALDPTFAAAYAELASAYVTRLAYVTPEDTRSLQQKAAAADTAMSLDPDGPEAYLARGDLLWTNSHRFPHDRTIAEFRRALELVDGVRHRKAANPSHHAAYFAGCTLARMGRGADAVRWLREASDTGFPAYALFARDPLLDPIRGDAVFQEFMAEMEKKTAALRRSLFPE